MIGKPKYTLKTITTRSDQVIIAYLLKRIVVNSKLPNDVIIAYFLYFTDLRLRPVSLGGTYKGGYSFDL